MEGVMSEDSSKAREIDLGKALGEVVVRANGVRIELHADGSADAYIAGALKIHPAAKEGAARSTATLRIGDEMEDGTILAGYYRGRPLYTTPKDASEEYTFNEAVTYAKSLDAHGHHDFHAPTKGELNVLWENRDKGKLKGTFNETGSSPAGWYWSSSPGNNYDGWAQCFSDGHQITSTRNIVSSLRLVR
jgi:hypothetical protein